jgi:hypothetical protein
VSENLRSSRLSIADDDDGFVGCGDAGGRRAEVGTIAFKGKLLKPYILAACGLTTHVFTCLVGIPHSTSFGAPNQCWPIDFHRRNVRSTSKALPTPPAIVALRLEQELSSHAKAAAIADAKDNV